MALDRSKTKLSHLSHHHRHLCQVLMVQVPMALVLMVLALMVLAPVQALEMIC